ncbi:hypothetical protein NAEGRDRAFT_58505 [Naegleria gruberi]|uniref:Uncharacterized protein n=1 Tax=Naegleria gruberi TaxID=5762 RepID=D2VKM9_NAEGR|nr:uncharacterized protein NAEGRDRAFT_58505 [Naegleria gruberi]EFC42716.1 hypothetical protein NAEGRDRAFT_58505 [Naegleria gruberi]|eukprot:XP_002675460.1 hypothetical protein NAEGRDRAFT_58505 [Naegleria gruberi strain NEG-M]
MKSQPNQDNATATKKRKLKQSTLTSSSSAIVESEKSSTTSTTPLRQTGTGLHLDSWPYNLWGKLNRKYEYEKLDRFRPFQSMLCLSDGDLDKSKEEGSLEIIPGFPTVSADGYFEACDEKFREGESMRKKSPWVSPYHVKFVENDKEDSPLFELIRKVKRVPKNWSPPSKEVTRLEIDSDQDQVDQYIKYLKEIAKEHDKIPYEPIQRGDYIFFDIRMPHQNSKFNYMSYPRCVFYHAFEMAHPINMKTVESLRVKRKTFETPNDFSSEFQLEKKFMDPNNPEHLIPLTPLGECLFREKNHSQTLFSKNTNEDPSSQFDEMYNKHSQLVTQRHLEFFHRYGYVVIENAISKDVCNQLLNELGEYSKKAGCGLPVESIIKKQKLSARPSKEEFRNISGPFGSMIEYFYLPTQQRLRMNEALYCATVKLLANTWCCNLEVSTQFQEGSIPKWKYQCPIEKQLDPRKLWTYVDRMNFRFPNKLK